MPRNWTVMLVSDLLSALFFVRAIANICSDRSMPITLPGRTLGATRWATSPVPVPTSSTCSPFCGAATSTSLAATRSCWPPAQLSYVGAIRSKKSTRWSIISSEESGSIKVVERSKKPGSWGSRPRSLTCFCVWRHPVTMQARSNRGSAFAAKRKSARRSELIQSMEGTINAVEDSHMAQAEKSATHSPGPTQNGEKNIVNLGPRDTLHGRLEIQGDLKIQGNVEG